jgi:hypothetical protein
MPAPRIDHLLGSHKNHPKDRQDFEDLLRRAASLLSTTANSPRQYPSQEASAASTTELLRARAS